MKSQFRVTITFLDLPAARAEIQLPVKATSFEVAIYRAVRSARRERAKGKHLRTVKITAVKV